MTKDYSSIYTIKEIYQNLLPLYFGKDELALSSVGALGMFVDVNSSTTEDMVNIVGRYINEIMPGQAELPDFIYAQAANYGVTNILSTPAKLSMLLLIKEQDVIDNTTLISDHLEFTLDSNMQILIDDLYFSIPYDIKIRSSLFNNEYNHMAYYDMSYLNSIADENIPFIKTMKTSINGDTWLVLRVNVYQYLKVTSENVITTNNTLNIPYIDKDFSNQLCNFEVFYTPPGSNTPIQLEKRSEKQQPVSTPFIYYKFTGDNSIRFLFANDDRYFIPAYNSSVTISLYETNGTNGNFPSNKQGVDVFIRAKTDNENIAYNRSIFPLGFIQGGSVGGTDQLTLNKVKTLTSEKQITVGSYTTDNDLNEYFNNFASIYNHKATFVKQRDDYAGREYGCFSRINDGIDIVPTNTLNIRLKTDQVDSKNALLRQFTIKPGTIFKYESDSDFDTVIRKSNDDTDEIIEYALAPLMIITSKPNKVDYYMNTIKKDIQVDYTYFNLDSIFNFVVKSCNISRDAINGDDAYHIDLRLARVDGLFNDIQSYDFTLQNNNGEINTDRMEVLIIFNTKVGDYIRMKYVDANNDADDFIYTFSADIHTNDLIDDGRIMITDLLKRDGDISDERLIDMMNPDLTFSVFYDYEGIDSTHQYEDISIVSNHMLCNTYVPKNEEFYFAYPLDLIRSHVIFEDDPESELGFSFFIKQVPLFGKDFLLNHDNKESILDDITNEHLFLKGLIQLLHGLFTINMKFYNTYGRGRNFYIGSGTNRELINRINCNIHFGIKFYDGIIVEDYIEPIKLYIKSYFEDLNLLSSGTNQAFISVLERNLHNTYSDQIKYCIFYSINDYDSKYQIIETIKDMNDNSDINFVPEYLTLRAEDIIITTL